MTAKTTKPFDRDYARLPDEIQKRADKQLELLLVNPHHPSLRLKKMEGHFDLWEGRITKGYRFTFKIVGDAYVLRRIGPHDILKNP